MRRSGENDARVRSRPGARSAPAVDRFEVVELACDPFGWGGRDPTVAVHLAGLVVEFPTASRQRHPGCLAEARGRAETLADLDDKSVYGQYALRALADVMENVNTDKWYRRQQKRAS